MVSPLNTLINNQISQLRSCGIQASAISVKSKKDSIDNVEEAQDRTTDESYKCDFTNLCEIDKLLDGYYNIVFVHPESLISTKFERNFMLSKTYKKLTIAIVVDEAHYIRLVNLFCGLDENEMECVLILYLMHSMLIGELNLGKIMASWVVCSLFPDVPVVAMTATASLSDVNKIEGSLGLKECKHVIGNPNQPNIVMERC